MAEDEDYNWQKQYEMQMCLERVGWEFYKIRASEFYRNPNSSYGKINYKNSIVRKYKKI